MCPLETLDRQEDFISGGTYLLPLAQVLHLASLRTKQGPPLRKYPTRYRAVISALREVRLEKGISQRALSEKLGEVHNFVNMIEKGQRSVLAEELIEISLALDVDPHEVLTRVLKRKA